MEPLRLCSVEPLNYSELFSIEKDSSAPSVQLDPLLLEITRFFGLKTDRCSSACQATVSSERYMLSFTGLEANESLHLCFHMSGSIEDSIASLFALASDQFNAKLIFVCATMDEHSVKQLQWLNDITIRSLEVYGLELNLWRAVLTNGVLPLVSAYVDAQGLHRQLQVLGQESSSPREDKVQVSQTESLQVYTEFWLAYNNELLRRKSTIAGQKPGPRNWMSYPFNDDFSLVASLNPAMQSSAIGLVISGSNAQIYFEHLNKMKDTIERELAMKVTWQVKPEREICRIFVRHYGFDFTDKKQWPSLHTWLVDMLEKFQSVFEFKIHALYLQGRFDTARKEGLKQKMGWDVRASL